MIGYLWNVDEMVDKAFKIERELGDSWNVSMMGRLGAIITFSFY